MKEYLKLMYFVLSVGFTLCFGIALYDYFVEGNPIGIVCIIMGVVSVGFWFAFYKIKDI